MSDLDEKNVEERAGGIDAAKLDDLVSADKITQALSNFDDRISMFKTWNADEDTLHAVLGRLQGNGKAVENMPILSRFNDFRTAKKQNQYLTNWMDTSKLDEVVSALKDSKISAVWSRFNQWYNAGVTSEELSTALAQVANSVKAKTYKALESHYKEFEKMQLSKGMGWRLNRSKAAPTQDSYSTGGIRDH